jgi:hypothetical protein
MAAVLLDAATALYKVHSVPASGSAVFLLRLFRWMHVLPQTGMLPCRWLPDGNIRERKRGLTIVNGASGVSAFTLKLDAASGARHLLRCRWCGKLSQTTGSGIGNLTFAWDASLESSTLANKRLYKYASGAWTVLTKANTTAGTNSLTYSGYTDALSSTRFGIASGLTVTPTPTDPLCTGGTGSLSVSADGGLGTRSYKLGTGSWQSSNQFTGLVAGTYTVYVKDDAGNEESSMVTITDPPPVTANVTGNLTVCSGKTTTLTATGGSSYLWNGTLGTNAAIMVSPTTNTTYSVSVTAMGKQLHLDSLLVTVTVNSLPTAVISGTTTICNGGSTTLTASGATTFAWSGSLGANASVMVNPTATTTYTVTVTDGNGCTDTETSTVTVNSLPTAVISGTTTICNGGSTTLTASGATTFAWSGSLGANASVMVNPTATTTYTVTVTDGNGCTDTETSTVTVNSLPVASISGDLTVCSGETTTLTASGANSYAMEWHAGYQCCHHGSTDYCNTTYSVTVTDMLTATRHRNL